MEEIDINSIPRTAFVLFNFGAFGGAERRFTTLFRYLEARYPGKFYYFINNHLLNHINRIFPGFPKENIRVVDGENNDLELTNDSVSLPGVYRDIIPDPVEVDRGASWARKLFWFGKNKLRQRRLFKVIEKHRSELGAEVLVGVFSGILPLVFYLKQKPRKAAIVFSDMDSWFSDVHPDMKKLWYRKYYSFNYALENSDLVDFLSPFVIEGVKNRNVKLSEENISVTACSAADYSKCVPGNKDPFEIAFCGRLEPDKNPLLYLQCAKELLKEFPEIRFHLLGEGSLVNEINEFITVNNLKDNVNFIFHNNPPEIFSRTSVFVSLQTGTNYPSQSVLEAMACENAVVASNCGDTSLLVNNSNGILAELNVGSVTAPIRQLIKDPILAHRLGANAREFVMKHHTIEKEAQYYVKLCIKAKTKAFGGNN